MSMTTTPEVQFRAVDGVRIRYADSGGSHEATILLTSPWPESVYAYARMWARWPSTPACSPSTCGVRRVRAPGRPPVPARDG